MSWRRPVRALHRDIGYLVCVLTVLYAVSGLAVNHIEDWNPSYAIREEAFALPAADADPAVLAALAPDALEGLLVDRLSLEPGLVQGRHRVSPAEFKLFLPDGGEVRLDLTSGAGRIKRVRRRFVLFESNVLHLNHIKGVWTWVADAYAITLLFLALSGLVMLRGKYGLAGRGKWFVAAGTLLPAGFLLYYYLTR